MSIGDFIEFSYVNTPADRGSFVGYLHVTPDEWSKPDFSLAFHSEVNIDPEQVLLDRFRDVIMEVEGIMPEDDCTNPEQSIIDLLDEFQRQSEHPLYDPNQLYGAEPVWIAAPEEPPPGTFYIGDFPSSSHTITNESE